MTGTPQFRDKTCGSGDTAVPFVNGTLVGLRTWSLDSEGVLRGVTYPQAWTTGENVARCYVTKAAGDNPFSAIAHAMGIFGGIVKPGGWDFTGDDPTLADYALPDPCDGVDPKCACGFYAYHDPKRMSYGSAVFSVTGIIEGYGRIILGPAGFRAAKARVVAVAVSTPRANSMLIAQLQLVADLHDASAKFYALRLAQTGWLKRLFDPYAAPRLRALHDAELAAREEALEALQKARTPSVERWEKFLARYPDVLVYDTVAEMRAAHPSADVSHLLPEPGINVEEAS